MIHSKLWQSTWYRYIVLPKTRQTNIKRANKNLHALKYCNTCLFYIFWWMTISLNFPVHLDSCINESRNNLHDLIIYPRRVMFWERMATVCGHIHLGTQWCTLHQNIYAKHANLLSLFVHTDIFDAKHNNSLLNATCMCYVYAVLFCNWFTFLYSILKYFILQRIYMHCQNVFHALDKQYSKHTDTPTERLFGRVTKTRYCQVLPFNYI